MVNTINREQYNKLSDDEKKKWVLYTPTSDPGVIEAISDAQAQEEAAKYMKALHDKLGVVPLDKLPTEELKKLIDEMNKLLELKTAIEKIGGVVKPIVNPLVNVINSIIKILGSLLYLIFAICRGGSIFFDDIHKIINDVKWDELDDAMVEWKKTQERNAKNRKQKSENKKKVRELIDKEKAKEMEEFEKTVKKSGENLDLAHTAAKAAKITDDAVIKPNTWEIMFEALDKFMGTIGIDLSPLDQPTEKQMEKFEKAFPDPTKQISKINNMLNNMQKNATYITVEDKKKLEAEAAKETAINVPKTPDAPKKEAVVETKINTKTNTVKSN